MNPLNILRFHPMAEAGKPGGGNTSTPDAAATPTETPAETTEVKTGVTPESVLDDQPKTESSDVTKTDNLLDDDQPKTEPAASVEPAPSAEQIKSFTDSIKAIDLGDGVKWDDAALTAMTPELMRMSGGDAKKVEGLVKAYTAHQQAVAKSIMEQQDAMNKGLIEQCRIKFGDDLKKVAEFARIGGREIFGPTIWNEMKKVPSFCNNPEVVEKLAEWGRKFANDGGKVTPRGDDAPSADGDVLHRMYGNVKV